MHNAVCIFAQYYARKRLAKTIYNSGFLIGDEMIYITEKAAQQVKTISDGEGIGHYIVRVKVLSGGCGGFKQDLNFDDQISDMDEVYELDSVKVIIDQVSLSYMEGTIIDYGEGLMGAGFIFSNPTSTGNCGCGRAARCGFRRSGCPPSGLSPGRTG